MNARGIINKGDTEAVEVQELFLERLQKVCDGSVYTMARLKELLGCQDNATLEFVRMCDVSPAVAVHRHYGRKGQKQYSFVPQKVVDAKERIMSLAKEITEDSTTSARSHKAAHTILVLLGANHAS